MESTAVTAATARAASSVLSSPTTLEAAPPPAEPPSLEIERGPNWLFVRVKQCRPGHAESESLAQRVASALDQHFVNRVVLELDEAALPCDRLIEELRALDHWIQEHQGVLRICGLPPRDARRFHGAHLPHEFPLYREREEAVWGGPHHCQPR